MGFERRIAAAILTADDIINAADVPRELVHVPEWGGSVYVQGLTGTDRDAFEESILQQVGKGKDKAFEVRMANMRAKLCVRCMTNDEGARLFTDEQAEALGRKSAAALDRVFEVAQRLSGIGSKDLEELAGN